MERFGRGCILEVNITKEIMVDTDMSFEPQLTLNVELTPLDVTNNTSTAQIILLFQLLRPRHRKAIEHNSQNQRYDDLIDEYHIDILEDLEGRYAKIYVICLILLEEVPHEAVDCFEGCKEDEGEALTQMCAVWIRLVLEEEVHDDAEEVLKDYVGNHRQEEMVLRPPNSQQQGFYIK